MKQYTFEYTRQQDAYLLLGASFAIIVLGMMALKALSIDSAVANLVIVVLFALAIAFFMLNKYRIKRKGSAHLSGDRLLLELAKMTTTNFNELHYYYFYEGKNGIAFTLGFKDRHKLKLTATNNFCNIESIKALLTDVQAEIERYNTQHQAGIIHLESIYARRNAVYVLSALTLLVIAGISVTHMPLLILPISMSISLLVAWIRYFQLRGKGQLTDI